MSKPRYDLIYDGYTSYRGPFITQHFCREWEGDEGCYGYNPNHGFTFEEARAEVIAWWQAVPESNWLDDEDDG